LRDNTQFVVNQPAIASSPLTPIPNLADSIRKYESYKYESQNVVTPPALVAQNVLNVELAPPIQQQNHEATNNQQLQDGQQQLQQPIGTNQITTNIKAITYEELDQQLKNLNKNILEDFKQLLMNQKKDPSKANESIFFKYSTNFYYVT
jgi:hypothetical protein